MIKFHDKGFFKNANGVKSKNSIHNKYPNPNAYDLSRIALEFLREKIEYSFEQSDNSKKWV